VPCLTCTLCEAICGITAEVRDEVVVSIRGDADDPFSRGHICPKAAALKDVHEDPDRLRRPMVREGTQWRETTWDDAFVEVTRRIGAVRRRHGGNAVAVYLGNPTVHSLGAMLFAPGLVRALRTTQRYSATSVDQLPHMVAAFHMFGHQLMLPVPDLDRTDHLLVFGANPAVSNGSLMTAPGVARRIAAIRARGGRVVVVDPRRTETARLADRHHFIRPGADALVLLAMLHVLFDDGAVRLGASEGFTDGVSRVGEAAARFPPERVAEAAGIEPDAIRGLAREFAGAARAVCYGRVGVSTQEFGTLACWLVNVLNVVTGRLDVPGGAMFPRPAVDVIGGRLAGRGSVGRWRSRVRGLPAFGSELPAAALAEEIDTPGPGQVRALVTHAGNPVLSTPNGTRLERALAGLDFMLSIDIYLNETTRHAHVILPPTFALERDHYDLAFHGLAVRNTAKFSPALFPRPAGARHDWEILNELSWRLAAGAPAARLTARALAAARAAAGPRRILDYLLRTGPYGAGLRPFGRGLTLARLARAPHGIDLGPLDSCLPDRLHTPGRRLQLAPDAILADLSRLEAALAGCSTRDRALSLIGRRDLRSNNSWMHNSPRLVKGPPRCTLLMHPDDAAARGLADGDTVRVRSRAGAVEVTLEVTADIMRGVVSLPHGWGHDRPGLRLAVAAAHPGASLNDLTDEACVDAASGNAAFSGVQVEVDALPPDRGHG
jgi:anaerobic selenocysteine-containing dehydrogenase